MDKPTTSDGVSDVQVAAAENGSREIGARGRSNTARDLSTNNLGNKRGSLHTSKAGGDGYDFSSSYEQMRRVRFKFGGHSLAVEATLAKLFESLTVECR